MLILIDLRVLLGDYYSKVKKFFRVISVVLIAAMPIMSTRPVHAASASITLSPSSATVSKGSSISVGVRVNSGSTSISSVQANLSYPSNLLQFVSISSSSAFGIVASNSGGGGSVSIGRGALPAVSGSQLVATVTFRALASSGVAKVSVVTGPSSNPTGVATSGGSSLTVSKGSGSYTLRVPPTPAPAPPAKPADKIPPTIKTVGSSEPKVNGATITWITSEPSTSEVHYGPTDAYGATYVNKKLVTNHKVVLSSALLTPGLEYHFMVKSVDGSGNAATSSENTFRTQGADLLVKVVNQDNKAVSGAKVTIRDRSGTTNNSGQVTLEDLPEGKLAGTVEFQGKKTAVEVDVTKIDPDGDPQPVTFKIETEGISPWIIAIAIAGILAAIVILLRRRGGGGDSGVGRHFSNLIPGRKKSHPVTTPGSTNTSGGSASQNEPAVIKPTQPPGSTGG